MLQSKYKITENIRVAPGVYRMTLEGDTSAVTTPGQFVNIRLIGRYLRRPIAVHDIPEDGIFRIIYKAVGDGTRQMSEMTAGEELDILTGLGNGYDMSVSGSAPVLIGGGAGVPPMYYLARRLMEEGRTVKVVLGFNTAEEVFCEEDFRRLGAEVTVMTLDGSRGLKGLVTDAPALREGTYIYACGPEPMLKAVYRASGETGLQMSFEARMGCGFGACMGCSCRTITGYKRICREGPVMRKEEILWED